MAKGANFLKLVSKLMKDAFDKVSVLKIIERRQDIILLDYPRFQFIFAMIFLSTLILFVKLLQTNENWFILYGVLYSVS